MENFGRNIIYSLLEQKNDRFLTVLAETGVIEFYFHHHHCYLMTPCAEEKWQECLDSERAEFLIRTAHSVSLKDAEPLERRWELEMTGNLDTPEDKVMPLDNKRKRVTDVVAGLNPSKPSPPGRSGAPLDSELQSPSHKKVQARSTMDINEQTIGKYQGMKPGTVDGDKNSPGSDLVDEVQIIYIDLEFRKPIWVGRMDECDVVIDNLSVSRWHCQVIRQNGLIVLKDNQSSNGCFAKGKPVKEAVLTPGELFHVGGVACTIKLKNKQA